MTEENSKLLPQGSWKANLINYGISATKGGKPRIIMVFRVESDEFGNHNVFWGGSLNEGKAREITLNALLTCGLNTKNITELAGGMDSKTLDATKDYEIVVGHETMEATADFPNPKTYARVKFVNTFGGSIQGLITKPEAMRLMQGLNIEGDLMKMALERNIKLNASMQHYTQNADEQPPAHHAEIPF